jgi:hypothetical protein
MKIGFTINLGNYESMRIESSEFPAGSLCLAEIRNFLESNFSNVPAIKNFLDNYLRREEL